jgi:conjugal transfer/entry exclusion protein
MKLKVSTVRASRHVPVQQRSQQYRNTFSTTEDEKKAQERVIGKDEKQDQAECAHLDSQRGSAVACMRSAASSWELPGNASRGRIGPNGV